MSTAYLLGATSRLIMKDNQVIFLSAKDVATRYGIGISTVWDWSAKALLPSPLKFGERCTRWKSTDLDKHDEKIKAGVV